MQETESTAHIARASLEPVAGLQPTEPEHGACEGSVHILPQTGK